jgi:alkanesulfonate monooxygenase SsuD/methylene tetrahydromethanopterin reductase-like flavin-dependent oxidoreductase (luciferase family)
MRFGLKVNPGTWPEAAYWAGVAHDVGFDGLWTGDNLRNARDPLVPVHDGPTIISAWAATTSDIRVGLLIANLAYRRPTVLAKQAVSIDHVSGGRFDLGIGSGLWPADHAMAGVPFWAPRERAARLAEFVGAVDRLLRGEVRDHDGEHYRYHDAAMSPAARQARVPIIVAANGPKALAVAAEHGAGWVTFAGAADAEQFAHDTAQRAATLDALCRARGRDPGEIRRILLAYGAVSPWASRDAFAALVEQYRALGIDEIVCYAPKPDERAVFDSVTARLDEFR